ncbi:MAG: succinate dehydrogenase/fumarate reductase iron-sulfur subunit [Acidobacteria bacterium]|nr:succinate dehydrogenase/fumarate reductase iron-sulfur subunit [Acidobacteriota bacterium]
MPLKIAVRRFEPQSSSRHWASYVVELGPGKTVADALLDIQETQDATLAFRCSCRSGICGACAGIVNGAPRLLCQTLLGGVPPARDDTTGADLLVEPLPSFPVLRDLVVDMTGFFDALAQFQAWLVPNSRYEGSIGQDRSEQLWKVTTCVLCGICDPGQGVERRIPNPSVVARILRLAFDPRDAVGRDRLRALQSLDPPARARLAERLALVCPAGVDIRPLIEQMGSEA